MARQWSRAVGLSLLLLAAAGAHAQDDGCSGDPSSGACFLSPDGSAYSNVCTPISALTDYGSALAGQACFSINDVGFSVTATLYCTDSGDQYQGAEGCWTFASSTANLAVLSQPDLTSWLVSTTQCSANWWTTLPIYTDVPVGATSYTSPTFPLSVLNLAPGTCPDSTFAGFFAASLVFAPYTPGSCEQNVVPGIAGSEPGSSLGCPDGDCSLFWQPLTISCGSCGGTPAVSPSPAPVTDSPPPPPPPPPVASSPPPPPPPPPVVVDSPPPPPPAAVPSPSPPPAVANSPPPPPPPAAVNSPPPPPPPAAVNSPPPSPPSSCPNDNCAGGFQNGVPTCFSDSDNNFAVLQYNQPQTLNGATFTVPPPTGTSAANTFGAFIATPTSFNTYSNVIYKNKVETSGQVLNFNIYACVPDNTQDEGLIAEVLFDTLIEVDLLDASGNTASVLFTATIDNIINEATLTCVWNKLSAPIGKLLPLGSDFTVSTYITWFANKQPGLTMVTVADDFTFTCPNGVSVSSGAVPPSPPVRSRPPLPPSPQPPTSVSSSSAPPPCSSSWWKKELAKRRWRKKHAKKSYQGRRAMAL